MDTNTTIILVTIASIITSAITAAVGLGGGLLLLAILPNALPAKAIIPIHGAVQLSSNFSRFVFDIKHTCYKPFILFTVGSLVGAYFGKFALTKIDLNMLPLFISAFIIFIIWFPINNLLNKIPGKYLSLGIVQTALSMYVGATGPLSTSVLISDGYSTNQVIVTNAAINTSINIMKLIVFFFLGFSFYDYYLHIIFMMAGAVLGSYLGSRIRRKFNEARVKTVLKVLITLLCVRNIFVYLSTS